MMFCCNKMKENVEKPSCLDRKTSNIIIYDEVFDEYGIFVSDGGNSCVLIEFCPWCGKALSKSKRDIWFDELEQKGYFEPFDEEIPPEYRSKIWRKNKDL